MRARAQARARTRSCSDPGPEINKTFRNVISPNVTLGDINVQVRKQRPTERSVSPWAKLWICVTFSRCYFQWWHLLSVGEHSLFLPLDPL